MSDPQRTPGSSKKKKSVIYNDLFLVLFFVQFIGGRYSYYNNLVLENEEILLPKPYVDTTKVDYTKRKEDKLNELLEKGIIRENNRMGNHIHVYKFMENELVVKLNDNLEVIFENKPFFTSLNNFDLNSIPAKIRPEKLKIKQPTSIQEYYVLNDGKNAHVFTPEGKYISSHKGRNNEFFSLNGLHRKLKFRRQFVPIGQFITDQGQIYYVRLTDGFEYKK